MGVWCLRKAKGETRDERAAFFPTLEGKDSVFSNSDVPVLVFMASILVYPLGFFSISWKL